MRGKAEGDVFVSLLNLSSPLNVIHPLSSLPNRQHKHQFYDVISKYIYIYILITKF